MPEKIIIIGGGAAGLMAAGRAAEMGTDVLLFEKTRRLGNKLRITGKGRCNLTNNCPVNEFMRHLGPNGAFMHNAFARFFVDDLLAFFEDLGVPTVTERGNRVFPASQKASDVVDALRRHCLEQGVHVRRGARVEEIITENGEMRGVRVNNVIVKATKIVLATGGMSYPSTGSTGDGYEMAKQVRHTVTPLRPGLVPLITTEDFVPRLQGLSLRNVQATLYQDDSELASEFGEMLFTHFGVSGPIILTLSSQLRGQLDRGPVRLCIDLKPALSKKVLDQRLLRDIAELGHANYHTLLEGLLPRSLIDVFMERSGISRQQRMSHLTREQRRTVIDLLKSFEVTVVGKRPFDEAIITLGGVACDEIVPQTMASRRVRGLYLAGEIIDVAGDTGGYNLQIAFTTGYLAGESAACALLGQRE
ncbi:MAG: NAD(P)/FAD-dependent oxidoreductase [Anaerolineae bacterium]